MNFDLTKTIHVNSKKSTSRLCMKKHYILCVSNASRPVKLCQNITIQRLVGYYNAVFLGRIKCKLGSINIIKLTHQILDSYILT